MSNQLKIATYNIRNGLRYKAIVRNLAEMEARGASLFCLQETRKFKGKSFIGDKLEAKFGKSWKLKYFIKPDSHDIGLCVMWKPSVLSLVSLERYYLPKIQKLKLGVRMLEKLFFNRPLPTQRGAIIADFKIKDNDRLLRVLNIHLDWLGGKHKIIQLNDAVSYMCLKPKAGVEIVCGDFNTVGPFGIFRKRRKEIMEVLGKDFINDSPKGLRTSRTFQKLDYIFVKGLKLVESKRLKRRGSDHWPLLATLEF